MCFRTEHMLTFKNGYHGCSSASWAQRWNEIRTWCSGVRVQRFDGFEETDGAHVQRKLAYRWSLWCDNSLLRWQESWMTGATNLTESDGQNAITLRVEGGRKGSSVQSQCPSFFFCLTCLAGFPIATDDFWALSSCWQHLVCGVTHTHTVAHKGWGVAHTRICRSSHHPPARRLLAVTAVQFSARPSSPPLCGSAGSASDCRLNPDPLSRVHFLLRCHI